MVRSSDSRSWLVSSLRSVVGEGEARSPLDSRYSLSDAAIMGRAILAAAMRANITENIITRHSMPAEVMNTL